MRLIDADALRDEVMSIPPDRGLMYTLAIAKMIDDAPTIDPENMRSQWIPVAERLPEKYEDVLITYRIPSEKAARIWIGYRAETGWCAYGVHNPNVTAWMPIPEPYEPDGAKIEDYYE